MLVEYQLYEQMMRACLVSRIYIYTHTNLSRQTDKNTCKWFVTCVYHNTDSRLYFNKCWIQIYRTGI